MIEAYLGHRGVFRACQKSMKKLFFLCFTVFFIKIKIFTSNNFSDNYFFQVVLTKTL